MDMVNGTFSHVVIGAGSAGCVVAARIAENPTFTVLVVEAGPDCDPKGPDLPIGIQNARKVPMKGQSKNFDERIDWNIVVDLPQGGSMKVPQAKIVGGGSSINGGTALRSTREDSRQWVRFGNDAWDYRSVSSIYDFLEHGEGRGTENVHPIIRTKPADIGKIQKAFLEAGLETGFPSAADFNIPDTEGIGSSPVCRSGDLRVSASNTFLDPIREQKNLTIHSDAQVARVIIKKQKAAGIILVSGQEIFASEEVIVCAGAVFSPAILQRSGIGPAELLTSLRIPLVSDVPVGANLSDHVCIPLVAVPRKGTYEDSDYSLQMQARWSSSLHPGWTDLQLVCFSFLDAPPSVPGAHQRTLSGTATGHVAGIGCNLNKPSSLGTVRIHSTDPLEAPTVAPNYLQSDHDRELAREIVRKAYSILNSERMQEVLHPSIGLDASVFASEDMLDAWIQDQYSTTYHFSGTCRMARRDMGGVVDQNGRVYGVQKLRVCDASVIPSSPAANTMWTTMMFAERIGSSIRDRRDLRSVTSCVSSL